MGYPTMIIGTFQVENQEIMNQIVCAAATSHIYAFDTAPSYCTEKMLGNSLNKIIIELGIARTDIFIQDKIDAFQMLMVHKKKLNMIDFVYDQIERLKCAYIDAMFMHWPFQEYFNETYQSF